MLDRVNQIGTHPARDAATFTNPLAVEAVVCIPTFRRPGHLLRTLESIAAQTTRRAFAVLVVENDAEGCEGLAAAARFFKTYAVSGTCLIEKRQGNCHAINAAFRNALMIYPGAQHILMLDDDEVASPDWLEEMIETAERTGCDIVGGPVFPRLPPNVRPGLARHPALAPAYDRSGPVPLIYGSGNCLITRRAFGRLGAPFFDERFNFLGGGDTDFFRRAQKIGMKFQWVAEAEITETVPIARTRLPWLFARGLRIGAINYQIDRKGGAAAIKLVAKNLAAFPVAFLRAARLLAGTRDPLIALHPLFVALGRSLAALGIEPAEYRAKPAKPA